MGTFRTWGANLLALILLISVSPNAGLAGSAHGDEMGELRDEIRRLKQKTGDLERKLDEVEATGKEERGAIEARVEEAAPGKAVEGALSRYWGDSRALVTGYGFAGYQWDDGSDENSFNAAFVPIALFRINDRILFEAEVEFELEDNQVEVGLEYALADIILTDNITLSAGKFLLPFNEFAERLHPAWINKLVSFPSPYEGANRIVPFTELGAQLRGGVDMGKAGLFDYAIYVANGPRFDTGEAEEGEEPSGHAITRSLEDDAEEEPSEDEGVPYGARLAKNFEDLNRGKAYGARVGFLPLPPDGKMGRLRLGASTYNGQANENNWYYAWGIDASYRYDLWELRGEYLHGTLDRRGQDDTREGWYVQGSYELSRVLPAPLDRLEVITRYSGANRLGSDPLRKPRQVAVGFDYWLTPSVALKLEYDHNLPSDASDSNRVLSQVAVGF